MNPANRPAMKVSVLRIFVIFFLPFVPALVSAQGDGFVSGKIVSAENNGAIPYATVFLKETRITVLPPIRAVSTASKRRPATIRWW